jgi:hypothetical protein
MTKLKLNHYHRSLEIKNGIASISDSLTGFDIDYRSSVLEQIIDIARDKNINQIVTAYILDDKIQLRYPDIHFSFNLSNVGGYGWERMHKRYTQQPLINYNNFISSFNGSPHVSRKLLVACLYKHGLFDPKYCTKNFSYSIDELDGHISDFVGNKDIFYRKFFTKENDNFCNEIYNFESYSPLVKFCLDDIFVLDKLLTESFLHIVSETMATSYHPFITEKVLYGIVTQGLFLCWAQPGYHAYFERNFGFKKYTKLFDYEFDNIKNPIHRLITMISMLFKFKNLSKSEWNDLYRIEKDTVEFNYHHYYSGDYLKNLAKFS